MMAIFKNKILFYTLYTLGSFLFFLWILFPSDFFADYLEKTIKANGNGINVTIEEAKPTLGLSLALKNVTCTIPSGPTITAESFKLNPGLISLMRGNPEVSFKINSFGGQISGHIIIIDNNPQKMTVDDFMISDLNLNQLNDIMGSYLPGYTLQGTLDAKGHYTAEGRGIGEMTIHTRNLVVEPSKPMFSIKNLNFKDISLDVEIKSKKVQIRQCEIDGKEVDGTVKGSIFVREPISRSTLRLTGTLRPEKEFMETLGASVPVEALIGNKMNADGELPFRLTGVASSPRFKLR